MKYLAKMRTLFCFFMPFPLAAFIANSIMFVAYAEAPVAAGANAKSHYTGEDIHIRYWIDQKTGTLQVCAEGTDNLLNYMLARGSESYNYNAQPGQTAVMPLNMGDGEYSLHVRLFIYDKQAEEIWTDTIQVRLENKVLPYLSSSDMVNWKASTDYARKAVELAQGKTAAEGALAIGDYIAKNFTYSTIEPEPGYIPDPDETYASRQGICFDISVLMAAMCRAANIPCMLAMGYSEYMSTAKYHAWCLVWADDAWQAIDPTYSLGASAVFLDPVKMSVAKTY